MILRNQRKILRYIESLKNNQNDNKLDYDLIFIDHRMPIMDGVEALHQMSTFPHLCKDTPCIALTANVIQGAKEQYISEGFVEYIAKPFNKDQIKEKLRKIFV